MTSPHHPFLVFKVFFFTVNHLFQNLKTLQTTQYFKTDITWSFSNCFKNLGNETVHFG